MKKLMFGVFALLGLFLISGSAFAQDGDIYNDGYLRVNSSGDIVYSGSTISATPSTITSRVPIELIVSAASTTGTVTVNESGTTYILTATSGPVGGVGYTMTLPGAADGLKFSFVTATNQTLAVRSNSATDLFIYHGAVNTTRLTSPASSGCTLTVVGSSGRWFVTEITSPPSQGNQFYTWTNGTR